jgi:hypothetical protein
MRRPLLLQAELVFAAALALPQACASKRYESLWLAHQHIRDRINTR